MRLRINTEGVEFRVAGMPKPRTESRDSDVQKRTPDGRLIWIVRLSAFDSQSVTTETIWTEVTGDEPRLVPNEVAAVTGLTFAPWVNRKGEIVRAFRAEAITQESAGRRSAA